jgi:hypothetical protein
MKFDRAEVHNIREALETALTPLGKQLGLGIRVGSATYTPRDIRFKVEVFSPDAASPAVEQFRVVCHRFGLEPEDLGKGFTWAGRYYTLVGCRRRSTRFPLIGRAEDGKDYKFPADVARLIRPRARGHSHDEPTYRRLGERL